MDLPSLAVVLQAALSPNLAERKAAEDNLNHYQYTPQHLVRLLQIIVEGNCDMAVRQVASIHFKNLIAKNWSPYDPDTRPHETSSYIRVDSVFALRSFVEAFKDLSKIWQILPQLFDEFFKLMNKVENEDLVFTLKTIVDKFGEEMAPYAIGLCQKLCMNTAEADDEAYDPGALAAVGCLHAISTILESVSRLPHLFVHIEPTLLPIMRLMLTDDGQEVFEEVLEIVSYMTFLSPSISMEMWSLWPLLMEALADWAIDFFPNILVPLDNYISWSTVHYLTCKEPDDQQKQLPGEALERVFKATLELLVAYKDQVAAEKEDPEDDGLQTDDDDDDGSDKEMGDDVEDGEEADSLRLQKLAAQAKAFRSVDDYDDDSDDDFSDGEDLQSPIDEVDPLVFFVDAIKVLQASDPMRFQNLSLRLDIHYQALANSVAQHAEQRRAEIEEELEKVTAAAAAS